MATRLYFRSDLFDTVSFPGSYPDISGELQAVVPSPAATFGRTGADAVTVHRTLKRTKGSSQTSFSVSSLAQTATQTLYVSKFISDPLQGVTSINAETWVWHSAHQESNLSANFSGVIFALYVWRPSTNTIVGSAIHSWQGQAGFAEPASIDTERLGMGNIGVAGDSVSNVQNGDVIIIELYYRTTQAAATSYTDTWFYNGSTEYNTTNGTVVSDIASYIETPQNLGFVTDVIDATSNYKDILKQRPQTLITNSI